MRCLSERAKRAYLGLSSLLLVSGCVYDHRVTQAIRARRQRAKQAEGAELVHGRAPAAVKYMANVRVYVSEAYRQQHPSWRESVLDLMDNASAVAAPTFAVRFEVERMVAWSPACDPADLAACLQELEATDPGGAATWVVGVLGSLPRFTTSFEQLGLARVSGRHFLVRDVSDLQERAAIDAAFASHTRSRRDEIYARRKHHKRLSVFLHEWAHTLGAEHVQDGQSLLYSAYDDAMTSFDAANSDRISAELDERFQQAAGSEQSAGGTNPVTTADGTADTAAAATAPSHALIAAGTEEELLAGLDPAARDAYRTATLHTAEEDPEAAYEALAPLVEAYPDCYAVQHLACGLLMQLGHQRGAQIVCPRLQQLSAQAASAL